MAFRIYIATIIADARAEIKKHQFKNLGVSVSKVEIVDCYTVDAKVDNAKREMAKRLLANKITEKANFTVTPQHKFDYAIEIGYLPGVTDNIGRTAKEALADGAKIKFKPGQNVYSSQVLFITHHKSAHPHPGPLPEGEGVKHKDIQKIADSLYNPLIQRAVIISADEFKKSGLPIFVPAVKLTGNGKVLDVDLDIADEELEKLGKLGIAEVSERSQPIYGLKKTADKSANYTPYNHRGPLALDLESLKAIRSHFKRLGRKPTDIELETLAQTWSEHCKHTIFASPIDEIKDGLYKHYIKRATQEIRNQKSKIKNSPGDFCVSVFTDNSGAIIFDDNFLVTHKVETHNTPSALDPFGGAVTGIVGVNRDALGFGLGAKPIANIYGFCLADPKDKTEIYRTNPVPVGADLLVRRSLGEVGIRPKNGKIKSPPTKTAIPMLSAERIMTGVVAGINSGGNQSGIPTPLGLVYFDERFRAKPLVFAGTVGLIPRMINGKLSHKKQARPGDYIVMIGGRVGKDGIHGATFSSESLDPNSPATAVQIGDPITQKKFTDTIIREVRDLNLYNSITDDGAGGLASSIGEMAKESGGCLVNLDKVPVKYPGLQPWEIWISESQERMTLAVPKKNWKKLARIFKSRDVEATVIGEFTKSGKCVITYGKRKIMDVSLEFLHHGNPVKHLRTMEPVGADLIRPNDGKIRSSPTQTFNLSTLIFQLLSRLNICSYEFISKQYDHEVQGTSVTKPLQGRGRVNTEAAVIRPLLNSNKGIVLSYGLHPGLSELDPYAMAACSIDSAIRAAVASGADVDQLALLDNFCWCSSNEPERLWQLKQAARACYDYATAFGTPFISGKDSMFNDFKGFSGDGSPLKISIPPTLLISTIGVIPDVTKAITLDAKTEGDLVYILGETKDELGGSEFESMTSSVGADLIRPSLGQTPQVQAATNLRLYRAVYQAIQKNLVASAISINRGGLAAALAKMCIGGNLGALININQILYDRTAASKINDKGLRILFSESQGRLLVTIDPAKKSAFEKTMSKNIFACIGTIGGKNITIKSKDKTIATIPVIKAEKNYKSTLKNY